MPLIRVNRLNYDCDFGPREEAAVVNTDEIISVVRADIRSVKSFVRVRFRDGSEMTCQGDPGDFLAEGELKGSST